MEDCADERYRIIRRISQGGMGNVYLAYDRKLAVERVVKEVRIRGPADHERLRQQFVSEIHIIREIQHPGIPQVIDLVSEEDKLMIVMEKIEGKTLKAHIREGGPVSQAEVLDWGIQLARILSYLHGKDPPVFHRDIKPDNVILHPSGRLYLIDFGIAGHPSGDPDEAVFSGTIGYAPPEQYISPASTDGRGDIFSLGRLLSFCLYGNPEALDHPEDPGEEATPISEDFRRILRKCTREDVEQRYQDVEELLGDLLFAGKVKGYGRAGLKGLRVRVDKYALWIFAVILILVFAGRCAGRLAGEKKADDLLECAVETPDPEKKRNYYQEALRKAPWKESIYESILTCYVLPNHFGSGQAAALMNMLQEVDALPAFKKQNPEAYARFCYGLGIGYFYQMGGGTGKMESEIWFRRAVDVGEGLDEIQRIRASCYQKIGNYYRSFLYYGKDRAEENETEDYSGFFDTLRELTAYTLQNPETDPGSAWYVAYEVATEIRDYSGDFLKEEEITEDILLEELEKIEKSSAHLPEDLEEGKKEQLLDMIKEAKKRVQIMEANYEKQYETNKPADLPGSSSDAGNTAYSHDKH